MKFQEIRLTLFDKNGLKLLIYKKQVSIPDHRHLVPVQL